MYTALRLASPLLRRFRRRRSHRAGLRGRCALRRSVGTRRLFPTRLGIDLIKAVIRRGERERNVEHESVRDTDVRGARVETNARSRRRTSWNTSIASSSQC